MSCIRPLIRAETYETFINYKGGISYKAEFLDRETYDRNKWENLIKNGTYRRIHLVPCGQCIECRLNYSREWATRAMLEKKYHRNEECWFITLTYDNYHIPLHCYLDTETGEEIIGPSLDKKDLQLFWKRLRKKYKKKYPDKKIKYINAGEYGSKTNRPHYHALVYNLPLDLKKLEKWTMNEQNQPVWRCKELEEIWGNGNVMVGELTWESAAYVARYTLKKAYGNDPEWHIRQGQIPEFISMSQGIAKEYFIDHMKKIYETDSVPILNKKTKSVVKPPRSFDRMLKEVDSDLYDTIKEKRLKTGETGSKLQLNNTSLTAEKYRQQHEQIIKSSYKDMRKEM